MTSSIFSRRNVLVTGAGGFVGRHLAMALHGQGAVVHGIGLGEAPELPDGVLASWRAVMHASIPRSSKNSEAAP